MKTNKVFRWLYALFMLMPLIAIGVTCAYVTFNKNAKDSYGGEIQAKYESNIVNTADDIHYGNIYKFSISGNPNIPSGNVAVFQCKAIYNITIDNNYDTDIDSDINNIQIRLYPSKLSFLRVVNNSEITYISWSNATYPITFDAVLTNLQTNSYIDYTNFSYTSFNIYENQYNSQSTLDNAFYYAVDQFNESGFNKVNFVSFFDMFYNNENIWTTFANTYFNYVLFVSLAFFVPRVLFWFINLGVAYADGFIERSQRW